MRIRHLSTFILAASIACAASSAAAQDTRAELVRAIVEAQGLAASFDLQLEEQRKAVDGYAHKLFESAISSGKQPTPAQKAALERFTSRAASMMTGREVADAWLSLYGQDLSDEDLRGILSYYQSPIGRKDVAATRAAVPAMTRWMAEQGQKRIQPLLAELLNELEAKPASAP